MAVGLMVGCSGAGAGGSETFAARMEENAVREATAAGLQSVERLIKLLSSSQSTFSQQQQQQTYPNKDTTGSSLDSDYKAVANMAVDKFQKVISLLDRTRTGHARFRRGPLSHPAQAQNQPQAQTKPVQQLVLDTKPSQGSAFTRVYSSTSLSSSSSQIQRLPPLPQGNNCVQQSQQSQTLAQLKPIERKESSSAATIATTSTTIHFSCSKAVSATNSYMSSLTGDGGESVQPSMSSGFQITNLSQVSSAGKPPLSSSFKRKCTSMDDFKCGGSSSGRCHCPKRRKSRVKRVVRVPAISLKMADIPPDDYSWRKYGQKPIKGSPHPRGYYKCSSVQGCPARKHVERALDDAGVLIVTYEDEHSHSQSVTDATVAAALVLESS